jgi:hypothetical protein
MSFSEFLLFLLVGVIVSLDVTGLTAAKPHTYIGSRKDAAVWAQRNAFWHALLLAAYGLAAVGFFDWFIRDVVDWLLKNLPKINVAQWLLNFLTEIKTHFSVVLAFITIFVVWSIYKGKIVENPLEFSTDDLDVSADIGWQRRFIRYVLKKMRFSSVFIARQMEAVAVAIDMLALAFLLKSLEFFYKNPAKVVAVSLIIYFSVFATVFISSRVLNRGFSDIITSNENARHRSRSLNRILLIIRISEPLLIFYFICELLCFVVWGRMSSSALFFIASGVLTFALIRSVGLQSVVDTTAKMANSLIDEVNNAKPKN